jgi:hypothetical protein
MLFPGGIEFKFQQRRTGWFAIFVPVSGTNVAAIRDRGGGLKEPALHQTRRAIQFAFFHAF